MKTPKTVKGYLRMLIAISNDSAYDLKNITESEALMIGNIRADIQNELRNDKYSEIMKKYNITWK